MTAQIKPQIKQVDRGNLRLDLLFAGSLEPLGQAFEETGYKSARTDLAALRQAVTSEVRVCRLWFVGLGWVIYPTEQYIYIFNRPTNPTTNPPLLPKPTTNTPDINRWRWSLPRTRRRSRSRSKKQSWPATCLRASCGAWRWRTTRRCVDSFGTCMFMVDVGMDGLIGTGGWVDRSPKPTHQT